MRIGSAVKGFFGIPSQLSKIIKLLELQDVKIDEAIAKLEVQGDKLEKILAEVLALKKQVGNADLPQAFIDALDRIESIAQQVDDVNEDPASEPDPEAN